MFVTGPNVVKAVTNEDVDKETLGGAATHSSTSGVSHFMCDSDEETLMTIRELIGFIPSNNMEDAPVHPVTDEVSRVCHELDDVVPVDPNVPYDIRHIIEPVCDQQYFFEIQPDFAKNIVIGFGRMAGRTVGFVANQPNFLAGALDIDASDKAARFIRFCDCFNIPLIAVEDVPGFLPGVQQEHNGIIRHGAKIVDEGCKVAAEANQTSNYELIKSYIIDSIYKINEKKSKYKVDKDKDYPKESGKSEVGVKLRGAESYSGGAQHE